MRLKAAVAGGILAMFVAACAVGSGASPAPSAFALPTLAVWPMPTYPIVATCGGVGVPSLTLQGTAADGVYALNGQGTKLPVLWPPGYTADYNPTLEVRDPQGTVVAKAGLDLATSGPTGLTPCVGDDAQGVFGVSMVPIAP